MPTVESKSAKNRNSNNERAFLFFFRLDGSFKEVCWQENVLKEVTQLLPPQVNSHYSWEQSQDTITNPEFSQEINKANLKSQDVLLENQDSLIIQTPKCVAEDTDICSSPFHAGHMENPEGNFTLLGESPKRRLGDSSVENSPKRVRFDNESPEFAIRESEVKESSGRGHIVPEESSSKEIVENLHSEECHVVPGGNFSESERSIDSVKEDSLPIRQNNIFVEAECDSASDTMGMKLRHASIDSAMDSGLGDSCNSNDCMESRIETDERNRDESKVHEVDRHCWQPKTKECLATRLPGEFLMKLSIIFKA